MNLLIADDEITIRKGLRSLPWETIGIGKIFDVENGLKAKEILLAENIDIVICDIKMPGMTGLELAEYIQEYNVDVAIILLTGFSEFEYAQQALRNNVADYMLKPIRPSEILKTVNRVARALEKSRYQSEVMLRYENELENEDLGEQLCLLFQEAGETCQDILKDMGLNFQYDISLNSMAEKYHFSISYLSRMIKKETGYNFSDLLMGLRMVQAIRYLQRENVKIASVCEKAGFHDAKYFGQVFKKVFGCNPNEFRKSPDVKKTYSVKHILEKM